MRFTVDPAGLAALPAQLDRLEQDAHASSAYVSQHTQLAFGGVLNGMSGSHAHAVGVVKDFLDTLSGPVAAGTSQAVTAAMGYYQQTDATAAASLDATCRGAGEPAASVVDYRAQVTSFSDVTEPTDRLQPPPDRSGEFAYEPKPLALISPAAQARSLIVAATTLAAKLGLGHPWDPYEALLKPVAGDWNGLRGCTDVFDNVAGALDDMMRNVRVSARSMPEVWTGNAADAAHEHLMAVADAIEEAREPIRRLAESYETAAEGAHSLFEVMGELLNNLMDAVVLFIAEATAAVATSETIVGGIGFGAAAAIEAAECYEAVTALIEHYSLVEACIEAGRAAQGGFGLVDGNVKLPTLDTAPLPLPGQQTPHGHPNLTNTPAGSSAPEAPAVDPTPPAPTFVPAPPTPTSQGPAPSPAFVPAPPTPRGAPAPSPQPTPAPRA